MGYQWHLRALMATRDILGATPNDLIEVRAVNVQVAEAAGGARPAPSARRTVVRRYRRGRVPGMRPRV
jgi:hypothetical protein